MGVHAVGVHAGSADVDSSDIGTDMGAGADTDTDTDGWPGVARFYWQVHPSLVSESHLPGS